MKQRIEKYDFMKGFLIFGVTLGHMITALRYPGDLNPWIYVFVRTFDMPMFAFLAGFFLQKSVMKTDTWIVALNKIGTLLLPALAWEVVFGILKRNLAFFSSLWFFYALFGSEIIVLCLYRISRKSGFYVPATVAVAVLMRLCVPNSLKIDFLIIPCLAGFCFSKVMFRMKEKPWNRYAVLCCYVLFGLCLCFWKSDYSVWSVGGYVFSTPDVLRNMGIVVFRDITGVMGSIVMLHLWSVLYDLWKGFQFRNVIVKLGQCSMEQYILQCVFVSWAGRYAFSKLVDHFNGYNFLIERFPVGFFTFFIVPIAVSAALLFQWFVQYGIKRIPFVGSYSFGIPLGRMIENKLKKKGSTI